jgi:uncharacterized membrane protein
LKNYDIRKILLVIVALSGLGIMTYLTVIHYTNSKSFCDLSETVSCDVVTTSIYSEVFGIPISIGGLVFFAFVLFMLFRSDPKTVYQSLFFSTLLFLIPSLYFSLTELLFIKAFCILCESSKALMAVILILTYPRTNNSVNIRSVAPIIITGLVLSGILYFAQSGTVVKRDYSELIACLNEEGVTYYKSVRCSNCRRQEILLGDAYKNLNSIECHPDGDNPQPELCLSKGIDKTPTFILEPDGNEVRRLVGLQQIKDLADFAGCALEVN